MKSTDININNPMSIGDIDLQRQVESWRYPSVVSVTQEGFDLINIKDPNTIYVISDQPGRIYYGDMLIKLDEPICRYFIGIEPNPVHKYEYVIYMNSAMPGTWSLDILVPINRFADPQDALNALYTINNVGSHEPLPAQIYSILIEYINQEISIEDFLISCISAFGFRDDPKLQKIIQMQVSYICTYSRKDDRDIPAGLREEIKKHQASKFMQKADQRYHSLISAYSEIYDIIIKYNFFKDSKYQNPKEMLNLSMPVKEICKVGSKLGASIYIK